MAQDTGGKQEPVDIDDIEVSILILAKNPNNLKSTVGFLSRRGWPTFCVGNMSAAIEFIAEKKPDFVLVSFNHPSPTVIKLPELISQTFNLTCVGFVEGGDAASAQKLNQIKVKHKIFGQPSGPNFQRGIRRILAEKLNLNLEEKPAEEGEREKSSVTVRGGKGSEGKTTVQNSELGGTAASKGTQVIGGSEGDGGYGSVEERDSASRQAVANVAPSGGGTMLEKLDAATKNGRVAGRSGEDEDNLGGLKFSEVDESGAPQVPDLVSNGKYKMGRKRKSLKDVMSAESSGADPSGANATAGIHPLGGPSVGGPGSPDLVGMLKKSLFGEGGEDAPTERKPQSAMEKAVEAAVHHVCDKNPNIDPIPLSRVRGLGVFPIDSGSQPGYLVVAFEVNNREEKKSWLKALEISLQKNFQTLSVPAKVETGFWIDFPEVPFDDWVAAEANFTFKVDHSGAELGVAFFSTNKPLPKARVAPEKGMHTIELDEISTEQPVNFKAYLHLKKNKKYYLYLRNGRRLQPEQKTRLKGRKVNDIFMKSVDVENLRVFLAVVYLLGTVKREEDAA